MPATSRENPLLPTGTVTFLFTDIEGSTTLWEQYPDAMQVALARHDTLLRHAIESSDGCIVKTTGDGVHAVFDDAADALAACLAAQRALAGAGGRRLESRAGGDSIRRRPIALRVRMGLHTGVAELRDGDYFGASLNRAARIMSVAHGEQVLLSAATAELVRGQLPEGVTLREMGEHRLKGLLNPERLLQVVASDLRCRFSAVGVTQRGTACRPSAMPSWVVASRWPTWRDAWTPGRASSRSWASAAPARRGWSRGSGGIRSAISRAASGSAICRRPEAWTASFMPLPRGSTCRWARTTR